ncbi:hypothetical protein PSEUBRA_002205 [Kalmanozyma brasiliensis GHG001]|uniref:uncharacterized protein n=1 Tax=Kalmanozyma brasiliensis (strain GHG001) TaxID=1365824 RepID=UPI002867B3C7|nr:uncharacterized protein PSEUBRA_002205 [Kalmanozyma brasiliensis GHG001]KAF6767057.1 hypothetical protein PSEUBRA_002205 [Kalmanozyma brasiliensis GHG001]
MVRRLLTTLACAAFALGTTMASPASRSSSDLKHVLLRESEGYHDEVYAAFLSDLGASPYIKTTFSQHYSRWGMPEITSSFPFINPLTTQGFNHTNSREFEITPQAIIENKVDAILSVSCDYDVDKRTAEWQRLFHETDVQLLCVYHDPGGHSGPGKYYDSLTKLWIDADRITFLVLSEHVGKWLQDDMTKRGSKPIHWEVYIPVFELPQGIRTERAEDKHKSFVIQGNFESGRRDYNAVFQRFGEGLASLPAGTSKAEKPGLVLIGSGKPLKIPANLADNVDMHMNLEYPAFYKTLGQSSVLLPAFASPLYFIKKASSTINAAIIGGTIIIGDQKMLDAYTFLDEEIVFKTLPGESDVQAAMRYLALDKATRNRKLTYIRGYRARIIQQNRALLNELVNPAAVAADHHGVLGDYLHAAKSVPAEHPSSTASAFVFLIGIALAFIFRRTLVTQVRQLMDRLSTNKRDYLPVGSHSTDMRSK